jgi:alpha-1,2-mannosyltransferase
VNVLWNLGQLVVLGWLVLVGFRPVLVRCPATWRPLAFAAVYCAMCWLLPVRDSLRFGQVGIYLAALCVLDCTAARPRWPRGALIGIATAIKLTPGVFIPYLWLTGRRREAITATAWAAGLTLGTAIVAPEASARFWTSAVFDSNRLGANDGTSNQSIRGMLLRALPASWVTILWLAAVAAVAVYGYRKARGEALAGRELAGLAITGLMSVLLSPVAWIHHLAGFLPLAIGVLLGEGRTLRSWWMALGATIFFALSVPWYGSTLMQYPAVPALVSAVMRDGFGIGALALIWLVAHTTQPRLTRSPVSRIPQVVPR